MSCSSHQNQRLCGAGSPARTSSPSHQGGPIGRIEQRTPVHRRLTDPRSPQDVPIKVERVDLREKGQAPLHTRGLPGEQSRLDEIIGMGHLLDPPVEAVSQPPPDQVGVTQIVGLEDVRGGAGPVQI